MSKGTGYISRYILTQVIIQFQLISINDTVRNFIHISDLFAKMGQSYGSNHTEEPDDEQLVQLEGSVSGLLKPQLRVPRCLDDVPLGLLLVQLLELLGQTLKVQLVQLDNLNNKSHMIIKIYATCRAVLENRRIGFGAVFWERS